MSNISRNKTTHALFFFFYNNLIYPLMVLGFYFLSLFNHKIKKGLQLRKKINNQEPWAQISVKNAILIHCSSGEFEYAKPLIREIKKRDPSSQILVTYFSPSYVKQIQNFPGVDAHCPLPWDCPRTIKNFLEQVRPKIVLVSRTDLWPEFLRQCESFQTPVFLYSAVLSENSSKVSNIIIKHLYSLLLSYVTKIYCVSDADARLFAKLAPKHKIQVIGDTRFDQVLHRIQNPKELKNIFNEKSQTSKTFICGSTWQEDEAILIPSFKDIQSFGIQTMIAPHEPTESHLNSIENQLKKIGMNSARYSQITEWKKSDVLIIDQVGILAELYAKADFAFIGGSFKKQVHSVMEALAQGCIVYYGPYHHNNREAIDFLKIPIVCEKNNFYIGNTFTSKNSLLNLIQEHSALLSGDAKKCIQDRIHLLTGASSKLADFVLNN